MEDRILIYAPTGKDARLIAQVLSRATLESCVCASADEIAAELDQGAAVLLVADEALSPRCVGLIGKFLENQPSWSDFPMVVLSQRTADTSPARGSYPDNWNVTLLERPIQGVTLVSTTRAALRARRRQYQMREIDRRKDEFLAMLAHELRNPLAPIAAASELLKIPSLDQEKIQRTSAIISRQVTHMAGLIDDLLDVSRVSRGLVVIDEKEVDAKMILAQAVEQVRPLVEARRHRLSVSAPDQPAHVTGDLKRLIQVLANLLNNAAKYTPDGGEIALAMSVEEGTVTFRVSDNGIGMEPDVIAQAFDMFAQAARTSDRTQGGLGIGLALVKSLLHLHGGSVTAQSAGMLLGSTFTVVLPRRLIPALPASPPRPAQAPAGNKRLLMIVDDNVDAAETLGMLLEFAGYEILLQHSAEAALEAARAHTPFGFLLDIGLPDMDGSELARRLRKRPETSSSLIVAITGYGQQADRQRSADAGFDDHFVKPVEIGKLLSVLSAWA